MRFLYFLAALLLFAGVGYCAPQNMQKFSDDKNPIEVDSDSMELRSKENSVIFTGSVSARKGDLTIQSDKMVVVLLSSNEIDKIIATGNVRVRRGDTLASGQEGVFSVKEETVTLTGDPKIWQGKNAIAGKVIKFFIAEERYSVDGGVHGIYFPQPQDKKALQ